MGKSLHRSLVLSSELSNLSLVEAFVDEICDRYQIFNEYYGHIMLCLTESVKNAMVHGNNLDTRRKVTIKFESKDGALVFEVRDKGKGFDPSIVPDPTLDEKGDEGRGLFLIRSLSDEVEWGEEGKVIRFRFMTGSINHDLSIRRIGSLKSYYKEAARKPVA